MGSGVVARVSASLDLLSKSLWVVVLSLLLLVSLLSSRRSRRCFSGRFR
jgi:hypothetical protein